jgi:hypothetical protein
MYYYCMFDGDDMEPKWEAERKIAHELADKAWELENLSPDGRFVMVRPTTNYENIYYSLRYLYDKPVARHADTSARPCHRQAAMEAECR